MIINGIKCRKSSTISYRYAIDGDLNLRGEQVDNNYISFVKIKDCPVIDGFYNTISTDVKCITINHGATYYGYGKPKTRLNQSKTYLLTDKNGNAEITNSWIETPFYVMMNRIVYVAILRKPTDSLSIKREKKLNRILDEKTI